MGTESKQNIHKSHTKRKWLDLNFVRIKLQKTLKSSCFLKGKIDLHLRIEKN